MLLVEKTVAEQEVYGNWRVQWPVDGSTRHVMARCLLCKNIYKVDLYHLRRKDRRSESCRACSNRQISVGNKLQPSEALYRSQFSEYKKGAKKRGHTWNLEFKKFKELISSPCHYCGKLPSRLVESSWDQLLVSGVDRKNNSLGYTDDNSVSCCKVCNYAKRDMSEQEFFEWIGSVYENNRRYRT